MYGVFGKLRLTLFSLGRKMSNIIHGNPPSCGQIVVRASGGGWGGGGSMFPSSQQNFPCVPVFPKSISSILVSHVL